MSRPRCHNDSGGRLRHPFAFGGRGTILWALSYPQAQAEAECRLPLLRTIFEGKMICGMTIGFLLVIALLILVVGMAVGAIVAVVGIDAQRKLEQLED